MRHLIACTLIGLAVLFVQGGMAAHVDAAPITFEFTGVWRDGFFGDGSGPVQPGDTFTGHFFYDPDAVASSNNPSEGGTQYFFSSGGAGIELNITTATVLVTFRSDPAAMHAHMFNNEGVGSQRDRFFLQSFASALFPSFYQGDFMRFAIDILDFDQTLLNSTALPTTLRIPSNGYAVVFLQGGATRSDLDYNSAGNLQTVAAIPSLIEVAIDIKPGSDPNCFNNNTRGVIPVAILSSAEFDATHVDPSTVQLAGLVVKVAGKSNKFLAHTEDVNGDGLIDLVMQIEDTDQVFTAGTTTATLTGNLFPEFGSTPIEGTDSICIVP